MEWNETKLNTWRKHGTNVEYGEYLETQSQWAILKESGRRGNQEESRIGRNTSKEGRG